MKFDVTEVLPLENDVDGLIVYMFEGELPEILDKADKLLKGEIKRCFKRGEFNGKDGEAYTLPTYWKSGPKKLIITGLGKRDKFSLDRLRSASAIGAKEARRFKLSSILSTVFDEEGVSEEDAVCFMVEGSMLGLYCFTELKTKEDNNREYPKRWLVSVANLKTGKKDVRKYIEQGRILAESVNFARDLVNRPGNVLTPSIFAKEAEKIAKKSGIKCNILKLKEIEKEGMRAFLSVAKGSDEPCRFIVLDYRGGRKDERPVVLVGKAVTFDSGGISIKPSAKMEEMKYDMSGGAAVLGVMRAIGELRSKVNVIGIIPAAENLPSGKASKPGDVVKSLSGQTIEIISTDAEGRMLLCDALSYGLRYKPRFMIDLATLTGACTVALGNHAVGIMGNDPGIIERLKKAGDRSGERLWELPLWDDYDDLIKSDVADMKNVGNRSAGTIVGGMFLKRFVKDTPWAHLDIAGTAWAEKPSACMPKGATGVGVRLIFELLKK